MTDEEKIAALNEKVRVLQTLLAMQTTALMNLWGTAKYLTGPNRNETVDGWLNEAEKNLKTVTDEIVRLSNG